MNSSTFGILAIIVFLTAVTVAYVKLRHWQEGFEEQLEGFLDPTVAAIPTPADVQPVQKNATFCPPGSKYFINRRGDSLCCEGTIEKRRCKGNLICTLSKPDDTVPSCTDIHNQLRQKLAISFCPPSMPNFFANEATGKKGCTSSVITTIGDGPVHKNAPNCMIGNNPERDLTQKFSCLNIKRKEDMACITPKCEKSYQSIRNNAPLVLIQNYTLPDETTARVCTDDNSMQLYLDKTEANWRNSNKPEYDFAVNTKFCGAAKRILVEKRVA